MVACGEFLKPGPDRSVVSRQALFHRCQLLREQALGASTELMVQLDESSLVQNELIFRTLHSIPKTTRQIYRNFRKNTDDFSGYVCQTAVRMTWCSCELHPLNYVQWAALW